MPFVDRRTGKVISDEMMDRLVKKGKLQKNLHKAIEGHKKAIQSVHKAAQCLREHCAGDSHR